MDDTTEARNRWFHVTPGRFVIGLLAVEVLLWLSERFGWLGWHKGYAVLTDVAIVGVAVLVMLVWFGIALVVRCRFQFSILTLLVLMIVVAVPCSWLAAETRKASRQREAVALLLSSDCFVLDDGFTTGVNYTWTRFPTSGEGPIATSVPVMPDEGVLARLLGRDFFHSTCTVATVRPADIGLYRDVSAFKYTKREVAQALMLALKDLPSLRDLDLSRMPVNDSDLEYVAGLNHLKELHLSGTQITDEGLVHLERMPELRILYLNDTQLTDEGLVHLERMPQLQDLHLGYTQVTDEGVVHFERMPRLQNLSLDDLLVTHKAVERLRTKLPNCHIEILRL